MVVAPSLIPRKPGDRVKTDRRDARKLAELFRAGLLTEVHPPTDEDEAVRDLCRAREDAHEDLVRCRHRVSKMLLRRGWTWNGSKKTWGQGHRLWLRSLRFEHRPTRWSSTTTCWRRAARGAASRASTAHRAVSQIARLRRGGWRAALLPWHRHPHRHESGRRVARLHALRLRSRPDGLPRPRPLRVLLRRGKEHRGAITKAGNRHARRLLIEASWHYRHQPNPQP